MRVSASAVPVHRSRMREECVEFGMVLESQGVPYEIEFLGGGWAVLVPANFEAAARREVEAFRAERHEVQQEDETERRESDSIARRRPSSAWMSGVVYGSMLLGLHGIQASQWQGVDWTRAGATGGRWISRGEWWRAFTALTLHADVPHVVGNAALGGLFVALLARASGTGVAWLTFVLAGGLGNYVNAWVRGPYRSSIGASTAVFGVLGALVAWQFMVQRESTRRDRIRRWAPIVFGVTLLAYLGSGDETTDVLSHLFGFLAGALLGVLDGHFLARRRVGTSWQRTALGTALGLLVVAWALAWPL